jgi:hypothetical protein
MKLKIAISAALIAGPIISTAAQTTPTFYVVQDRKTNTCKLFDTKPTGIEYTALVYKTRAEAQVGMKTVKGCAAD